MQGSLHWKTHDAKIGLSVSKFCSFYHNLLLSNLKGRSKYRKENFIGCSAWKFTEHDKHRYLTIPSNVDEDILTKVMANDGVLPFDIAGASKSNLNASCVLAVHPRVALKSCRE